MLSADLPTLSGVACLYRYNYRLRRTVLLSVCLKHQAWPVCIIFKSYIFLSDFWAYVSSLCYLLGDSSYKIKLCSSSRGEERVRGKTMSYNYYPIPDIYLRLFKAFAIAFDITSLLLIFPSAVYLFSLYLWIISFICLAVGRTALYSLRTNFLISSYLLTFMHTIRGIISMTYRYLVICAFHHTLIISEVREFWMSNRTGWIPTMSCSFKHPTYILLRVSSKL